ncbi:MAG TPA: hypothetical protein VK567_00120, partial [Bradyrhizobium sp.]|nr:hypothetical protein [Bradyrhizobium sp.]
FRRQPPRPDAEPPIGQGCEMRRRRLEIYRRAVDLANTGKYDGWKEIQKELAKEGYERTFGLLASDRIRSTLDVHCLKSRQAVAPPA